MVNESVLQAHCYVDFEILLFDENINIYLNSNKNLFISLFQFWILGQKLCLKLELLEFTNLDPRPINMTLGQVKPHCVSLNFEE